MKSIVSYTLRLTLYAYPAQPSRDNSSFCHFFRSNIPTEKLVSFRVQNEKGRSASKPQTTLENSRQRLFMTCGGTLEITTRKPEGTKAAIRVPVKQKIEDC